MENNDYCVECPEDGKHVIIENHCKRCKTIGCKKCVDTDDLKCEKCEEGKVLLNGVCKDNCDSRYLKEAQTCKECAKKCTKCLDKSTA